MKGRDITPNEKECISQCIFKYWSSSSPRSPSHNEKYERCLTRCDTCGAA